jgi:TonB family protein
MALKIRICLLASLGVLAGMAGTQSAPALDFSGRWTIDPSRSHVSDDTMYRVDDKSSAGNIRAPRKVRNVAPKFPGDAIAAGIDGTVLLEGIIDRQGRIADLRLVKSIPEFDEAAIAAVWQWEYTPTLVDGKPVEIILTVTVKFEMPPGLGQHLDGAMVPSLMRGFGTGLGHALVARELSIAQDQNGLVLSREIGGVPQTVKYAPDAKPVTNKLQQYGSAKDSQYLFSSRWDGGRLLTDITWSGPKGRRAAEETISRDGDTLTVVTTRRDAVTGIDEFVQTVVYNRHR